MKPEEMNLLRKRYYDLKGQKEKNNEGEDGIDIEDSSSEDDID